MYSVSVTVPATSSDFGPGLRVLSLALSLHMTVQMTVRRDDQLVITVEGEDAELLSTGYDNQVLRAAMRVFQHFERAPAGLQITINTDIPWKVGLGAETALVVGGIVAANNLIDGNLTRQEVIGMAHACGVAYPGVVAAMLGGLSVCSQHDSEPLIYTCLDIVPLRVVVVVPRLPDYQSDQSVLPELVSLDDAIYNIGQTALLVEALRTGNFDLLAQSLGDRLHQPNYIGHIPSFEAIQEATLEEAAVGVVLSGKGPALLIVAENYHEAIASEIAQVFAEHNIETDTWILGVDRQGMLISVVE